MNVRRLIIAVPQRITASRHEFFAFEGVNNEVVAGFSDEEEVNEVEDIERGEMEGEASSGSQSEAEYETCDSGVSERSSLSDEGERKSMKRK